jgi:hypothetical protein
MQLFILWVVALVGYIATCLSMRTKPGISFDQAADAAYRFVYTIVPVLGAFVAFWFISPAQSESKKIKVDGHLLLAAWIINLLVHAIGFALLLFGVLLEDFDVDSASRPIFEDRINRCFQFLTILMTLAIPIVEAVLRGQKVQMNDGA